MVTKNETKISPKHQPESNAIIRRRASELITNHNDFNNSKFENKHVRWLWDSTEISEEKKLFPH